MFVLLLLAAAALALSACATRGGSVPYNPETLGPPDEATLAVAQTDARIAPFDKLEVKVFQVEDLSGEFAVDSAGAISFPLIGSVPAAGRSPAQLSASIATRLQKYLQSPQVQVNIKEATEQTVSVDGSVRVPGVYPVKGATSLMRAVALARGLSEDANPKRVVVFRTVKGEKLAGQFDLSAIRKAEEPDPAIYGNDIIIVDGARARSLFRDLMSTIPLLGVLRTF